MRNGIIWFEYLENIRCYL